MYFIVKIYLCTKINWKGFIRFYSFFKYYIKKSSLLRRSRIFFCIFIGGSLSPSESERCPTFVLSCQLENIMRKLMRNICIRERCKMNANYLQLLGHYIRNCFPKTLRRPNYCDYCCYPAVHRSFLIIR